MADRGADLIGDAQSDRAEILHHGRDEVARGRRGSRSTVTATWVRSSSWLSAGVARRSAGTAAIATGCVIDAQRAPARDEAEQAGDRRRVRGVAARTARRRAGRASS